jgi:hypothetical protein
VVFSSQRSGTTLLSNLCSRDEDILPYHVIFLGKKRRPVKYGEREWRKRHKRYANDFNDDAFNWAELLPSVTYMHNTAVPKP